MSTMEKAAEETAAQQSARTARVHRSLLPAWRSLETELTRLRGDLPALEKAEELADRAAERANAKARVASERARAKREAIRLVKEKQAELEGTRQP